jgi:hypothetical protein
LRIPKQQKATAVGDICGEIRREAPDARSLAPFSKQFPESGAGGAGTTIRTEEY